MGATDSILMNSGFMKFVSLDASQATVEQNEKPSAISRETQIRIRLEKEMQQALVEQVGALQKNHAALWQALETSLQEYTEQMSRAVREEVVNLSVRVAELIIRRHLPDQEMIREIIRTTLEPMTDLQGLRICLCPEDAQMVQESRAALAVSHAASDQIEIVAHSSLSAGDVMVESRNGCFDARISERLQLLEERLKERCGNAVTDNNEP